GGNVRLSIALIGPTFGWRWWHLIRIQNAAGKSSVPRARGGARRRSRGGRLMGIAALDRAGFDLGQVRRGVDDRGMRECLREIAEQPSRLGVVFFRHQ